MYNFGTSLKKIREIVQPHWHRGIPRPTIIPNLRTRQHNTYVPVGPTSQHAQLQFHRYRITLMQLCARIHACSQRTSFDDCPASNCTTSTTSLIPLLISKLYHGPLQTALQHIPKYPQARNRCFGRSQWYAESMTMPRRASVAAGMPCLEELPFGTMGSSLVLCNADGS
jgi:hypothetical protein